MPGENELFALSADEEKAFGQMAEQGYTPAPDDLDDIAERDPDAAADIAGAEADDTPDAEQEAWKRDRKVPFKVFDAERRRARAERAEREKLVAEQATMRERMNMLMAVVDGRAEQARPQPAQPTAPQTPDWQALKKGAQEDIFSTVEGAIDRTAQLEQKVERTVQELEQRAYREQVASVHTQAEQAVRAQVADYDDAINHLKVSRFNQLQILGWQPEQAAQQVQQEGFAFVETALKNRQNPAVAAYRYAMAMGYTPRQAQQAAQEASEGEDAGQEQLRDPQGRFAAQRDPKLDRLAESQARNKSLTGAGGGSPQREPLYERVAKMSDKEFQKFHATLDRDAMFKLLG